MVHRIIARALATGLLLATIEARAELDLTPVEQKVEFEGVPISQTGFRNGDGLVLYSPPAGWKLQGGGKRVELRPSDTSLASGWIEVRRKPATASPDAAALEKFKAEMTASLPREAEKVTWEEPDLNPVLLNQHETRRITVSYAAFAQRFTATLIVCNFAEQQVVFRLDTRTDDFLKQYDLFRRSLFTWQGLP